MSDELIDQLAALGFELVNIKDKEWLLIADYDDFHNSCIMLDKIEDVNQVIDLHKEVSDKLEESKWNHIVQIVMQN